MTQCHVEDKEVDEIIVDIVFPFMDNSNFYISLSENMLVMSHVDRDVHIMRINH